MMNRHRTAAGVLEALAPREDSTLTFAARILLDLLPQEMAADIDDLERLISRLEDLDDQERNATS